MLQAGEAEPGSMVELVVNRTEDPGTWRFGDGTIHHFAWNASTLENQDAVKFDIEGAGYTDISELKDRKYFKSVYVRTPAGALFEIAVTHAEGGWALRRVAEGARQARSSCRRSSKTGATKSSAASSPSTSDRTVPDNPHLLPPVSRWGAEESDADLVVLALHGRDQDPAFMQGVAERIDLPELAWRLPAADAAPGTR